MGYNAHGLLRTACSRVYASLRSVPNACRWHAAPYPHSHIVGCSSHFYAHIRASPKACHPHTSKLVRVSAFVLCLDHNAHGLLRTACSRNPTCYSHIVGCSSHFYAHIRASPKACHPHTSKLVRVSAFVLWALKKWLRFFNLNLFFRYLCVDAVFLVELINTSACCC